MRHTNYKLLVLFSKLWLTYILLLIGLPSTTTKLPLTKIWMWVALRFYLLITRVFGGCSVLEFSLKNKSKIVNIFCNIFIVRLDFSSFIYLTPFSETMAIDYWGEPRLPLTTSKFGKEGVSKCSEINRKRYIPSEVSP